MWGRRVIMFIFTMRSNVSCYQLKIDHYKYKIFYGNLMVTTKQKTILNTQKREKGIQTYHWIKSSNHKGREQGKKKKELQNHPENS